MVLESHINIKKNLFFGFQQALYSCNNQQALDKKCPQADNEDHQKGDNMDRIELSALSALFPGLSDREIEALNRLAVEKIFHRSIHKGDGGVRALFLFKEGKKVKQLNHRITERNRLFRCINPGDDGPFTLFYRSSIPANAVALEDSVVLMFRTKMRIRQKLPLLF
ncbi:MAG: hypothetical protein H7A26_08605 [Spirochaetales bacterium]|nr:hypothetical protein [Spirochaetales bacterium]